MSIYLHQGVIALSRDYTVFLYRRGLGVWRHRTSLRLSTTIIMSLYCAPSQTWTDVASPPITAVRPTGTVRTRDLATFIYHYYHVIILSFSQTWTGVCRGTSQHSFHKGFGYVCLLPLSRHYSVFLHRRGLV